MGGRVILFTVTELRPFNPSVTHTHAYTPTHKYSIEREFWQIELHVENSHTLIESSDSAALHLIETNYRGPAK